jgi:Cu/Ag efflux pump CusA
VALSQLQAAIANANQNVGGQRITLGSQSFDVRGVGLISSVEDIGDITASATKGVPVRVRDVATVSVGAAPRLGIVGHDDDPDVVEGIVLMRYGGDSLKTIRGIHDRVDTIHQNRVLPPGIDIEPVYDRADLVKLTTHTVMENLLVGMLLVSLVLWLFLGNIRAALITAINIPLALLFAFTGMVAIKASVKLPYDTHLEWDGEMNQLRETTERLLLIIPVTLLIIAFLAFNSAKNWRDTLIVLLGVPVASSGGLVALYLTGTDFSISAAMGFISILGVAVQDALLVVTYARQLRDNGASAEESARLAAQRRLRPVLMSTFVAMLGLFPAAVSRGIGSETQKPLAIVVIGGALALVILPRLLQPALVMLAHRKHAPGTVASAPSTVATL